MRRSARAEGHAARLAGVPALTSAALATLGALAGAACAPPQQQLCEAIARRDIAGVHAALERGGANLLKNQFGCTPVEAVFANTGPDDKVLTEIGVELVRAGLPAEAAWDLKDGGRLTAIQAAATNGNVELVKALLAVGLRVQDRDTVRALHAAAGAGRLAVVELMVREGVDPAAELAGQTPAAAAHAQGKDDVEQFLTDEIARRAAAAALAEKHAADEAKAAEQRAATEAAANAATGGTPAPPQ